MSLAIPSLHISSWKGRGCRSQWTNQFHKSHMCEKNKFFICCHCYINCLQPIIKCTHLLFCLSWCSSLHMALQPVSSHAIKASGHLINATWVSVEGGEYWKSLLKEIWADCHKQKKMHKSKGKGTSGLVILEAHSSCLVLQQVFLIYTLYGGLTMQ